MKKKKKIPTLPYNVSPIIPDKVDGLNSLNTNMDVNMSSGYGLGEEMKIDEATQNKLSTQDKDKLEKFVQDNDDVEEIKTYLTGLLNKKNESLVLKEYLEDDEAYEEYEKCGEDCNYNIEGKLPEDVQIYLDELTSGVWIEWGQLPSGICYFSDGGDVSFFSDVDDFIKDMRYNIEQWKEEYQKNPSAYTDEDYSIEFINLLESPSEIKEQYLKEDDSNLPPGVHYSDSDPRSPFYNGPEPEEAYFDYDVEVDFSQRGVIKDGYWETLGVGFDEDYSTIKYDSTIEYDGHTVGDIDAWDVEQAVYDVLSSDKFQSNLPLDTPDVYKVSGYMTIPYSVSDLYVYNTYDSDWGDETEYDTSNMRVRFYPEKATTKILDIERMSF